MLGTPVRKMPLRAYRGLAKAMWGARLSEAPPGQIEFALHPWIVANDKLKATGWQPKHTTRETFEITMRAHGKLAPSEALAVDVHRSAQWKPANALTDRL